MSLRPSENKMASIWLLGGDPGAPILGDCDGTATTAICSKPSEYFALNGKIGLLLGRYG
jgi:hypothetical protein